MNPNTLSAIHQAIDNDTNLTPEFRYRFKLRTIGLTLGGDSNREVKFLKAKGAYDKLGVSKSTFFAVRSDYPELKPVLFAGCMLYRSDWIDDLIDRVSKGEAPPLMKRNLPSKQQPQKRRGA